MVKKWLDLKGKVYEVVDLDSNPDKRQELIQATGAMTVPITEVDGQYVIGWNVGKLASMVG